MNDQDELEMHGVEPVYKSAHTVVNPSSLDDIGMRMERRVVVGDDDVIFKIRHSGALMMGIGRPAQLWEVDATKHQTCCTVKVFCDHKPIFEGKAFSRNVHRASHLGIAIVIRFVLDQRKHRRQKLNAAAQKEV